MKQGYIYCIQCLLTILLWLPSCTDEIAGIREIQPVPENKITLKLSSVSRNSTKAAYEEGEEGRRENLLSGMDVFIYSQNNTNCVHYEHLTFSPALSGTQEHQVQLNAAQSKFMANQFYHVFVIANSTAEIPQSGLSWPEFKTWRQGSLDPDKVQDSFLMDGYASTILYTGEIGEIHIPVNLKRAASKIRVSVKYGNGWSLLNSTGITKKLMNYAAETTVSAYGDIMEPELKSMDKFTKQSQGAGNANYINVYSYPNDWNNNLYNETYLILNVPVQDPDKVKHTSNYYKVPVNYRLPVNNDNTPIAQEEKESGKTLYKLQRNYLYDIVITIDRLGTENPVNATELHANYTIKDWTTRDVVVEVEGIHFLYVKDSNIRMLNTTTFTTTFESSSQDVTISHITINDEEISNGEQGIGITWTAGVKNGKIKIDSPLPDNFVRKNIGFTVTNGDGHTQDVTVTQYPAIYISSDISADTPSGGLGQDNKNMYIITFLTADFSSLPDPDEFDEDFGPGPGHLDPDPALGAAYAAYVRDHAVPGHPLLDNDGSTIDTEENNRRISPCFMLASQHAVNQPNAYTPSKQQCIEYVERDETTGETYSDWRMPTLAELYMIDILQNIRTCEVKAILEVTYHWSASRKETVKFMDPRIRNNAYTSYNASTRCVRDVKR